MGEVMDGIEPPAGHFVILIVLVVNFVGVAIGDEIVEPEEQDSEPSSPKRVAFPQMRLKLNKFDFLQCFKFLEPHNKVYHHYLPLE